jgi:hypothetical protein
MKSLALNNTAYSAPAAHRWVLATVAGPRLALSFLGLCRPGRDAGRNARRRHPWSLCLRQPLPPR